ncbi:hypothetical protein GCM10028862_16690 [Luteimonas pelagia]
MGYIYGFGALESTIDLIVPEAKWGEKHGCIPEGVTPKQLAKVIVKYADSHPENLHLSHHMALVGIFRAFPCESGSN